MCRKICKLLLAKIAKVRIDNSIVLVGMVMPTCCMILYNFSDFYQERIHASVVRMRSEFCTNGGLISGETPHAYGRFSGLQLLVRCFATLIDSDS